MKRIFEVIDVFAEMIYVLLTDKEQQRQLDYDNGCGEVE